MSESTTQQQEPADDPIARGLFFIVGTGRSGTTLLQAMLNAHPKLHIPPETHFFARLDPLMVLGRETLDTEQAILRYVKLVTAHPRWDEFGIQADELESVIRNGATDARRLFLWLLRRLCRENPVARLGEKTPRHEQYLPRITSLFPNAKIIHIHRDPRDAVLSMTSRAWARGKSVYALAKRCRDAYDRIEHFAPALGRDRLIELSCEELIREPERELRRVCEFLGENFDDAMLRYPERQATGFHPRERAWKEITMKPLDPSRIGRYKDGLSPFEIRVIEDAVGRHLIRYGYEPAEGVPPMSATWRARMIASHAITRVKSNAGLLVAKLSRHPR